MKASIRERIAASVAALRALPVSSQASEILRAVRPAIPFSAGFIERYRETEPTSSVISSVDVPAEYLRRMLLARPHEDTAVLPLVSAAAPGTVLQDRDTLSREGWRKIEGYVALAEFGLHHPLALKMDERFEQPSSSHVYLALFQDRSDRPMTPEGLAALGGLYSELRRTLERSHIPLVASQSILAQIVEESRLGFVCVTPTGRIVESNHRAHALIHRFFGASPYARARGVMADFVSAALRQSGMSLFSTGDDPESARASLVVRVHLLAKDTHALSEDVILLVLEEVPRAALLLESSASEVLAGLPPRLRQVAAMLFGSGKPYKLLAIEMGVSESTFRKHVERLYRALSVSSRAELAQRLRPARVRGGS